MSVGFTPPPSGNDWGAFAVSLPSPLPPLLGFVVGEVPSGLINSSNTTYTTSQDFDEILVYLNGVRMKQSVDYNVTGSNIFVFTYAPTTGDSLLVDYIPG
jgi:hypothetical protein